jgi:hypothetical protein
MLKLFSSAPEHPLASAKEGRRIAGEIALMADAKAIDEAAGWFESLSSVEGLPPIQRLERSLEIAIASLPQARRQVRDYMAGGHKTRAQEQQHWRLNHDYWLHLGLALDRCLADAVASPKALDALRPRLPLLLTALLMAGNGEARWQRLRHNQLGPELWARLGKAYLLAAKEKLADNEVQPYDAGEGASSPGREYLKLLLLHTATTESLQPDEIGLVERLATRLLPHFALRREPAADALVWIDAATPLPPTRQARTQPATPSLRYLCRGDGLQELEKLRTAAAQSHDVPAELGGGLPVARDSLLRVLEHLARCWSPTPPLRKSVRHRIESRISIVAGLPNLLRYIDGRGFSPEDIDGWQVEDISQGGMSVKLELLRNGWAKVGALIGFQPENGQGWQVGVIRRFVRDSEIQGSAGIETLSKAPRVVTAMDTGLQTDLVLLDPLQHDSSVRALLEAGYWEEGGTLGAFVDGRPWRLHAHARIEAQGDWALGHFIAERLDG